jgi:hypothetical protein
MLGTLVNQEDVKQKFLQQQTVYLNNNHLFRQILLFLKPRKQ